MYNCTYIHTCKYIPSYICTHTCTHIHICEHTYMYIHTYIVYTYLHVHTYIHMYIHVHIHNTHCTYIIIYIIIHVPTCTDRHTYMYIHVYINTCTYIHKYMYIHVHVNYMVYSLILSNNGCPPSTKSFLSHLSIIPSSNQHCNSSPSSKFPGPIRAKISSQDPGIMGLSRIAESLKLSILIASTVSNSSYCDGCDTSIHGL